MITAEPFYILGGLTLLTCAAIGCAYIVGAVVRLFVALFHFVFPPKK
jgi:hypothetical protein